MPHYSDGPDNSDIYLDHLRRTRPDDFPMVEDIIRLVKDAKDMNEMLCRSADYENFVVLHLQWIDMEMQHWTPFLGQFVDGAVVKPGKMKAFATFATTYLGQLFEGPIRHHLLTLGYLGGIVHNTEDDIFENYIWDNPTTRIKLKEFHRSLDNAVRNSTGYDHLHGRLREWHETSPTQAGVDRFGISKIRNQIQHAHWFLSLNGDDGVIVFPFLGAQPNPIRELDVHQWIEIWNMFLSIASSISIGIYAGFIRAFRID